MDIFKRMAQGTTADLNTFMGKKAIKTASPTQEKKEMASAAKELPQEISAEQKTADVEENNTDQKKVIQFRKTENLNEIASIKLEAELETAKSNLLPVFPIVRYLKNKCLMDTDFASLVNDERKTLAKCFQYVESEVKKALNSKSGWLDDNEVYAYAETYYMTDEAVFEKIAAEKAEAEKKRQEEVAKKRKEQEEKRKKAAKEGKKKKATKDLAVEKKVEAVLEENGAVPEQKPVPDETEQTKKEPVMQEQLCLEM